MTHHMKEKNIHRYLTVNDRTLDLIILRQTLEHIQIVLTKKC